MQHDGALIVSLLLLALALIYGLVHLEGCGIYQTPVGHYRESGLTGVKRNPVVHPGQQ